VIGKGPSRPDDIVRPPRGFAMGYGGADGWVCFGMGGKTYSERVGGRVKDQRRESLIESWG